MAFAIFVVNKASGFNKESFGGKILTIFITVKFNASYLKHDILLIDLVKRGYS